MFLCCENQMKLQCSNKEPSTYSVADPGFPAGAVDLVRGCVDSRGSYISQILYVEMKESGPLGGRAPGTPPLDPPMLLLRC